MQSSSKKHSVRRADPVQSIRGFGLDVRFRISTFVRVIAAVLIFLVASVVAMIQLPRPDALRQPRWFASTTWWRYPLEWNASSRLPKIECGLNAIQAVPGTSSVWAVGNKGMVVTSSDTGGSWIKKSLERAQAVPTVSPVASPSPQKAAAAFFQLPDLITSASAASAPIGEQTQQQRTQQGPPPSPSSSVPNASPTATPSANPKASPTPAAAEIEPLIAVSFVDASRGEAMGNMATRFSTTDGGETWVIDDKYLTLENVDTVVYDPNDSSKAVLFQEISQELFNGLSDARPLRNAFLPVPQSASLVWVTTQQFGFLERFGIDHAAIAERPGRSLSGVTGVYFLANRTNGWAVKNDGLVYRTVDGGLSWQESIVRRSVELCGVFFVDVNRGWIVGANGTILFTSDGGTIWQPQDSGTTWQKLENVTTKSQLNSISFLPDAQHGWIAGNDGLILSTDDGGATWVHQTQGLEGNGGLYLRFPAPWYFLILGVVGLLMWRRIEAPLEEPEESVADVLVSDRPLEEAAGDVLAFNTIARGLSRFLRNENTLPPLTMAITGQWGTGKSSLMNLLRADLRSYKFRPVWFNAWHHQKEEHMLASLLENIKLQAVPRWWTVRGVLFRARLLKIRGWRQWGPVVLLLFFIYVMVIFYFGQKGTETNFTALLPTLLARLAQSNSSSDYIKLLPLFAGVVTFLGAVWRGITAFGVKPASLLAGMSRGVSIRGLEAQTSFRQKFALEFQDVTRALGQRSMLIFIDDLDRCRPENVSETLEAVNFLTTSGECFVAIGMAREYVERCVGRAFKEVAEEMIDSLQNQAKPAEEVAKEKRIEFARQYLDKLINIEVPVPSPKQSQSLALLVASTKHPEQIAPAGRWQSIKLSIANLVERHWRLAPTLLVLGGLLFLGYYVAIGLRSAGPVIEASARPTPTPSPTPTASPTLVESANSTSTPTPTPSPTPTPTLASLNERPVLAAGARGVISRSVLPVMTLLVLIWIGSTILTRRPGLVVKDSTRFVDALRIWHPLVFARQPTPRATKRFMNYVRYLAMRQRIQSDSQPPLEHFLARLKARFTNVESTPDATVPDEPEALVIPDEVLVALSALQHLNPGCLRELPGPAIDTDGVWPRPVTPESPLSPLFDKAWREHESKFGNWGQLSHYREQFLKVTANVQVR
jgi:photosystem II stability/assembly factor-like uncharacterized protein